MKFCRTLIRKKISLIREIFYILAFDKVQIECINE